MDPWDEQVLVLMCVSPPKQKCKAGKRDSLSTVKWVPCWYVLKGHSPRKKSSWQKQHKKLDYSLQIHSRTTFGEKEGHLQDWEHHSTHEALGWHHTNNVWVFCCRRVFCTSQNRCHDEDRNIMLKYC